MKASKRLVRLLALAALVGLLATVAFAQKAAKGAGDTGAAGQQAAVGPNGQLRAPTPEESRKLSAAMQRMINRSDAGLTVVQHANGMKSVNLQDRFQSLSVAKKGADGKVAERCVTNKSEAEAFAKAKSSAKPNAEVK